MDRLRAWARRGSRGEINQGCVRGLGKWNRVEKQLPNKKPKSALGVKAQHKRASHAAKLAQDPDLDDSRTCSTDPALLCGPRTGKHVLSTCGCLCDVP